ncbi:hypothetical protein MVEN_02643900 [Mycena venus]|uniref:Uncharacterized protein n=1 Tax=Mycena venus TaxID=2733690 RepID=A0A8H6WTB4_9AGAR|nr:hypothetical protein MVEN_02643900 [Mycena venus]
MSFADLPRLTAADSISVRKLRKTVRATQYEDPSDQNLFLIACSNSVLQFRNQVASFALDPEIAECVFGIRARLLANNARLSEPPSEITEAVLDFANDIINKRQFFRDCKHAEESRLRTSEESAVYTERPAVLDYVAPQDKQLPHSPVEELVSIPSGSEESSTEDTCVPAPERPLSPVSVNLTTVPSLIHVRLVVPLSPIPELEGLLFSLTLTAPHPPSPSSPSPSLPDLVHDFSLTTGHPPVKGPVATRRRYRVFARRRMVPSPPKPQPGVVHLIPRPFTTGSHQPQFNYADDSLVFKPSSTVFHAPRNTPLNCKSSFPQ